MKFIDKSLLRQFVQCQIESKMPIDILLYKDDFFGCVSVVYRFRERKIVRPKYGNQQTAKPMIYHQFIVRRLLLEFIRYFLYISERSFAVFGIVKYGTKKLASSAHSSPAVSKIRDTAAARRDQAAAAP